MQVTAERDRIELLDVLRGFALLGILLINILGFGMLGAVFLNPGLGIASSLDAVVWAVVDIFAEGAMRCLFSMLFGAGIVLFACAPNAKSGSLFFRRNSLLLLFGLINLYLLIWPGDILTTYALAGALLYFVRNKSPQFLIKAASVLIVLMCILYGSLNSFFQLAEQAAEHVSSTTDATTISAEDKELADAWLDFKKDYEPDEQAITEETQNRRAGYGTAFRANLEDANGILLFVIPTFLLWDSLAAMLLGMAFFKLGILQGTASRSVYLRMAIFGCLIGVGINSFEVYAALHSDFHLLKSFPFLLWTYQLGRIAMGIAYIGLIALLLKSGRVQKCGQQLAAVGRMALTNYIMQSAICLLVFSGLGFGLFAALSRSQLYIVVLLIWLFQFWFSGWWLARYRFGPLEYLWRGLTYGNFPGNKRNAASNL